MVDIKSFLGTKIFTLKNNIIIDDYDTILEDSGITDVSYIMSDNDLIYEKTTDRLNIRISLYNTLRNHLREKLREEFIKYVNFFNTDYEDDDGAIDAYINNNLLSVYKIDIITLYLKTHNDENIEVINNEKNELILLEDGYTQNKNFKSDEIAEGETLVVLTTSRKEVEYSVNIKFSLKII